MACSTAKLLCLAAWAISGMVAHGLLHAAEWSAEPFISLQTFHTDNFLLTTAPHSDVWAAILSPSLKLNGEAEAWKVTLGAELDIKRYNEETFNTTEGALTLNSYYRGERNEMGLNAHFIRDNTLVSELATTGVVQAFSPRNEIYVNPTWRRALTARSNVVVGYGMTVVNYSNTPGTSLTDYREQLATLSLEHNLSERTMVSIGAYYDRFETDPDNFEADTVGVQAGIIHNFSETARATVSAGPFSTRSTTSSQTTVCNGPIVSGICTGSAATLGSDVESDTTGFTATADFSKRWETAVVSVRGGRELNPSGIGALVQTDLLRVAISKELSATVTALLDAGIYKSKYIGAAIDENTSRYFRVEPRVSWRVTPSWIIDAGYSYARQKYVSQTQAASANTVYVSLTYAWRKYAVSR
jgi:hypothetical protein